MIINFATFNVNAVTISTGKC